MSDLPSFHTGPAPRSEPRWLAVVLFALVVIAMPVTTTVIAVHRFPQLSTLDEFAHIDYVRRAEMGEVPRMGDKVQLETARDVACRTIEGRRVGNCLAKVVPPEAIDADGYSYEAQQPPVYYFVTAALRQPFRLVVNGYVNSARLTGMIWLSAGLATVWWFLRRRMGATAVVTATVCGLIGLAPTVVSQASVVNNDAAAILTGAVLLVGYEQLRRTPTRGWIALATAIAVLLVLIKPLAIIGLGAVTLALLIEGGQRRMGFRKLAMVTLPALAGAITYQAWQAVRDARATVPYDEVLDVLLGPKTTLTEYPYDAIGQIAPKFLSAYWSTDASMFTELWVAGLASVIGLFFIMAPSISTALGQGRRDLQPLQVALLIVMLVAPQLLFAQSYFVVNKGGGANARYALAMLPLMITALVPWLGSRVLRWLAIASVVILFGATVGGLLTHELGAL